MSNAHDDPNTFQLLIAAVPAPDPAQYQSWDEVLRRASVEQAHGNGKASIAVWSPGLDAMGNSHLGRVALEMLTKRLGWSIFGAGM